MAAFAPGIYHTFTAATIADGLSSGGGDQSKLNRTEFQFSISAGSF